MNRFRKDWHTALAGFLVVWFSGIVFLFCCQAPKVSAAGTGFCPLRKAHAHCNKAGKNKDAPVMASRSYEQGMECCGFIPVFFDKTRKIDNVIQTPAVTLAAKINSPKLLIVQTNPFPAVSYLSPVLLKGDTFLKNRTFRI